MYPKLTSEAKALFINLLETKGEFQITGRCRLVRENGDVCYCAAGLLGLVIHQLTGQGEWQGGTTNYTLNAEETNGWPVSDEATSLITVEPVQETCDSDRIGYALYRLNDSNRKTFAEIAKWVKENL